MRERIRRRMFPLIASAGLILVGMFTSYLGLDADRALGMGAALRPVGHADRDHPARAREHRRPLRAADRPYLAAGGGGHPAALRRADRSVPPVADDPGRGQPPSGRLAAGRSLPDRDRLPAAVRGRRPGRAARGAALDARAAGAGRAGILWSVCARWGHPEDAVAVGLLLYAVLAQGNGRNAVAGWLAGAAVCVQPLVLLALPIMLALLPWRRMPAFLVRAAAAVGRLGGGGRDRQLARHLPVGDQPARLPGHQPSDDLDVSGPADCQPQRRRGSLPAGHDRAGLPVRAGHSAPLGRVPGQPEGSPGEHCRTGCWPARSGGSRSRWRCGRSSSR